MEVVGTGSTAGGDGEEKEDEENEDESETKKLPIASLEWNPNRSHHVLLAAIGKCAIVISTGTGGLDDSGCPPLRGILV